MKLDQRERDSIAAGLANDDEEVRRLAVERVAALPASEAVPHLVERLGDSSWRVRKAAIERLVGCGDGARVADGLVGALADGENPGRRNAAVEALIRCGSAAVPRLIEATDSDDVDVRKFVVDALAGIGDATATPRLVELLGDPDANVRAASADALGAVGGDGAERALRDVVGRAAEDQLVRFSALRALSVLEVPVRADELGTVLDEPVLRPAALDLLGGREDDERAIQVLLQGLASHSRATREAAMRALLRLQARLDTERAERLSDAIREVAAGSEDLVPIAIERLEEAELSQRLVLVQFLGLLRARTAAVPILLCAHDEAVSELALATLEVLGELAEAEIDEAWGQLDTEARRNACSLFGRMAGERGAARLLGSLEDATPEIRAAAARAIGRRRLVAGLKLLVHRLEAAAAEEDFEAEEELAALTDAVIALAHPESGTDEAVTDEAISLLASRVEGSPESVRLAIARVLGGIGRRQDADVVAFLLKDPGARVRRAAVDALARLDPGTAAEPLRLALADESPLVRMAAASALGASKSDEVLGDLRNLAEDEDPGVRAAAVRALGLRFGNAPDPEARSTARNLLDAALDAEPPVALAAVQTLTEIGSPDVRRLGGVLGRPEPELAAEAVRCLAAHGAGDELDALVPLVSHRDWSVRSEAIQALAERGRGTAVPAILRRLETEQDEFVRDAILRALRRLEA